MELCTTSFRVSRSRTWGTSYRVGKLWDSYGNGVVSKGGGICKGVVVLLPNIDVIEDFLPVKLGCTDVILGMKWLETLGRMQVNWGH